MRNRRKVAAGFTLLEVLVATLLMAIAVAGLLANVSTSLRTGAKLTEYDRAAQIAQIQMDALLTDRTVRRFQTLEGSFDPKLTGWPRAGWRAQVRPFDKPPGAGPGVRVLDRIELEIWWMRGDVRKTFQLEGFREGVLRPEEAEFLK